MAEATITSKGRITIPVEVRAAMRIEPGDRVVFTVLADRTTVFRAKIRPLRSLAGSLTPKHRQKAAIERMRIGRK
jgi:AbrB family looped-hinge helix DNA binding protein